MSSNRNQPRSSQAAWPDQPPAYSGGQGDPRGLWAGGYQPRYATRRRRRRRGRGLTALIVVLVVLAGAFVIGDQVARSYAQNMIASKVQSSSHVQTKPTVRIKGWPFLTQVAARDIGQVDIFEPDIRKSVLDLRNVQATALGVHINSSYNGATIDTLNGTALIPFGSLESEIGVKGLSLAADPSGGPDAVKVTLSSLAGLVPPQMSSAGLVSSGPVSGVAKVSRSGSAILIHTVSLGGVPLSQLGSAGDFTIHVPRLPMGMQLSGVSVAPQGVTVQVSAHNTTLSGSSGLGG